MWFLPNTVNNKNWKTLQDLGQVDELYYLLDSEKGVLVGLNAETSSVSYFTIAVLDLKTMKEKKFNISLPQGYTVTMDAYSPAIDPKQTWFHLQFVRNVSDSYFRVQVLCISVGWAYSNVTVLQCYCHLWLRDWNTRWFGHFWCTMASWTYARFHFDKRNYPVNGQIVSDISSMTSRHMDHFQRTFIHRWNHQTQKVINTCSLIEQRTWNKTRNNQYSACIASIYSVFTGVSSTPLDSSCQCSEQTWLTPCNFSWKIWFQNWRIYRRKASFRRWAFVD